jgi:hypothetical protein
MRRFGLSWFKYGQCNQKYWKSFKLSVPLGAIIWRKHSCSQTNFHISRPLLSLITLAQCYPNRYSTRTISHHSDVWWKLRDSLCLSRAGRDVFFFITKEPSENERKVEKVLSFMEHWKMYAQIRKRKLSCLSD